MVASHFARGAKLTVRHQFN